MSNELRLSILDGISDLVFLMKVEQGSFTYAFLNHAAKKYTGLTDQALGKTFDQVLPASVASMLEDIYQKVLHTKETYTFEDVFVAPNKNRYYGQSNITPVINENGICTHILAITRDVTDSREYEERLEKLVYIDDLTGIPNRRFFLEQLQKVVEEAKTGHLGGAVLYLDGDDFKNINDRWGHDVGDEFLQKVAKLLQGMVRDHDTVARIGGDEFSMILRNTEKKEEIIALADRVINLSKETIRIKETLITPSFSIGIACFPEDGYDIETLLKHADHALYMTKRRGKNHYSFYQDIIYN